MRPTTENFYEWNEKHARKHDLDKFYNHPNALFRYIEDTRIQTLIHFAQIENDNKVLEVGCGAGHILEKIDNGELFGIDISEVQISRARKRLGDKVLLKQSPGENLPYEDKFFDRIICTEVFEHVLDPLLILKEMKRVLKDEGIVSLSVPNETLINYTKTLLSIMGLKRIIAPKKSEWDISLNNNLEEWHLHKFSLGLITLYCNGVFTVSKVSRVPFFFIPFRYVLQLRK